MDFGFQALANSVLPMSRAQRQQNEFSSNEARVARDFSAQQAELSRDWQEQIYERYNSLQGKLAQANEAGVNPLFALGASANMSPSSPNVAAPAAGGGTVSPVGQISDMTSAALGFGKLKAEIDNIKSSTRQMNARALLDEIDSISRGEINSNTLQQGVKAIQMADVDMAVKYKSIEEFTSRIANQEADSQVKNAQLGLIAAQVLEVDASKEEKLAAAASYWSAVGVNTEMADKLAAETLKISREIEHLDLKYWVDGNKASYDVYSFMLDTSIKEMEQQLKDAGLEKELEKLWAEVDHLRNSDMTSAVQVDNNLITNLLFAFCMMRSGGRKFSAK